MIAKITCLDITSETKVQNKYFYFLSVAWGRSGSKIARNIIKILKTKPLRINFYLVHADIYFIKIIFLFDLIERVPNGHFRESVPFRSSKIFKRFIQSVSRAKQLCE